MSLAKKDWSALSRLAREWSLEDEEEQQRERRRRHRALSSTSEEASPQRIPNGEQPATERLQSPVEAEAPRPPASAPQDEEQDVQALLRNRRQRRQAGGTATPIREQLVAEEAWDDLNPPKAQPQLSRSRKEVEPQLPGRLNQARRGPWAQKESQEGGEPKGERKGVSEEVLLVPETPDSEKPVPKALAKRLSSEETLTSRKAPAAEKTSVSGKMEASVPKPVLERKPSILERCSAFEKSPTPRETVTSPEKSSILERPSAFEKPLAPREKPSILERSSAFEKPSALREKSSVLERSSVFEKPPASREKASVLERSGTFEKPLATRKPSGTDSSLVSEKAQMFERPQGAEKAPEEPRMTPRRMGSEQPQAQEQPATGGSLSPSGEQGAGALPDKRAPAKLRKQGAAGQEAPSTRLRPTTLQLKLSSSDDKAEALSPTQATFSTSLKRSSPRTISFRMSPRRENPEAALTRSASVRLPSKPGFSANPGRGEKMQEKLQKYHLAIKRSESLKSPGFSRTEFLVTPTSATSVASKRHLFEKELVSGTRAERAALRENLQLPGAVTSKLSLWVSKLQESPEEEPQEVRKEPVASRRTPQEKQAEDSLDAEV